MRLHVFQDGGLDFVPHLDVEHAGEEALVLHLLQQRVVIETQRTHRSAGAIEDRGNFSGPTQAAARTFPCIFPELRDQVGIFGHGRTPDCFSGRAAATGLCTPS